MTAPYLDDAESFLASPTQEHITRATLSHPDYGTISVPIPESSTAVVTFDENSSPRVSAGLSVPLVDGVDVVDARTGWRLEVDAGYKRPDGVEDVHPLCDLGVRRTPRRRAPGLLEVAAVSDEALVIDASPAVAETLSATSPAAGVSALLGKTISPAPYIEDNLSATGAVSISPLEDRWSALVDLVDRYGAQIYDDGLRTWHALPQPSTPAEVPDLTLRAGVGGTVVDLDEDVDRDAWSNYVLLRYRWRTAAGADAQVVATAYVGGDGPYAITGSAGRRIFRDDREVATTQAEANAAAAQVLTRTMSRAETMTVRAVAAYWVRPGHTVDVVRLDGSTVRAIVSRVAFDLVDGSMTVQTRLPAAVPDAATTTPPPDAATPTTPKPPVADPAPPAKSAYVTEWPASSTATYRGNGIKRTDVDAGDLWQGMFSGSYNGNQKALALFTAANSVAVSGKRSETGKTVSQALSGATVSRVEVVATVEHTWANPPAGADIRIGYYDATSAPASGLSPRPYVQSNDWTKGSRRVVNVTSSGLVADLRAGSARGITFGPGASTSTAYYARLSNVRLRIHYSK